MDARKTEEIKQQIAFERQRTAPPEDFPRFPDLPAGRYTDPGFFALEQEHIWARTWLLAGHRDQLAEPGSYFLWEDAGPPVIVLRDNGGAIRAFYNTCQHRGGPVAREPSGRVRNLRCHYHSWTYDLQGELIDVPDERDFVGLDKSCRSLVPLRCEMWGGWIFLNQDPDAIPLQQYLGSIPDEVADFRVDELRFIERHHFDIACNWKVAIDAFNEVYHIKHIHPNTVDKLIDHRGAPMGLIPHGHSRMPTPVREDRLASRMPSGNPLDIETVGEIARITNLAYNVFPNFIMPTDSTGFPVLLFWPQDIRTTRMDVLWFGKDWGDGELPGFWKDMLPLFDHVLREDTENLPWIQKSVESPAFRGVPLSYQERRIYHVHEEIDRVIGVERIPEALRVTPLLGPYVEGA
jgi:phenylpropionate dioxygenase-like ring-hydroxylating dioxygenase large terminal subunit